MEPENFPLVVLPDKDEVVVSAATGKEIVEVRLLVGSGLSPGRVGVRVCRLVVTVEVLLVVAVLAGCDDVYFSPLTEEDRLVDESSQTIEKLDRSDSVELVSLVTATGEFAVVEVVLDSED